MYIAGVSRSAVLSRQSGPLGKQGDVAQIGATDLVINASDVMCRSKYLEGFCTYGPVVITATTLY